MYLKDFEKVNKSLYNEWVEYYQERAEQEFNSLYEYRIMQREFESDEETGFDGDLNKYITEEVRWQLEMDKDQGYMENEIYK